MSLGNQVGVWALAILLVFLLSACGAAPTATPTLRPPAPTFTPQPTSTPVPPTVTPAAAAPVIPIPVVSASTVSLTVGEWQRVQIPTAGISLDVPQGWGRTGGTWEWSPTSTADGARAGVNWADAGAGREPTALLPGPAISLGAEAIALPWGTGTMHTIQIVVTKGGDVLSVENHALVRVGSKRDYDIYASGRTLAELTTLRPVLQHMLESVALVGG